MAEKDFVVGQNIIADNISTPTETTITTNSATTIATFDKTTAESAQFIVSAVQGPFYGTLFSRCATKVLVAQNQTTASATESGEVNTMMTSTMVSNGGVIWTSLATSGDSFYFGNYIYTVAYGNGTWVVGGVQGRLLSTADNGAWSWTSRASNFSYGIHSVAYGNNLWVAGGAYGELRTSTDTVAWVTQTSNFGSDRINSVAYNNSLWVAGGYTGQLRTSTDAVTWVTQTSNFPSNYTGAIRSVAYSNSLWVAAGGGDYGSSAQLRTSTDTVSWTTRTSNFGNTSIRSVAYGNNLWVAGGYSGQLRTSAVDSILGIPLTLSADISGSDVRLRATVLDAATTSVTVKVRKKQI